MEGTYVIYYDVCDNDDFYLFLCIFARLTTLSIIYPGFLVLNQKIPGFCWGCRQASINTWMCGCVFPKKDKWKSLHI